MEPSNLYKGSLTTIILKLLNENDKMYGYEITQGLLGVEVVKVGNRVRKYYQLTEAGTKETVEKLAELESYIRNMRALVNPKFRDE